jgi:hypothetical protein
MNCTILGCETPIEIFVPKLCRRHYSQIRNGSFGKPPAHEKHGGAKSTEYYSWQSAKDRCTNPKSQSYERYGGRGIKMCERWLNSFAAFIKDMGKKPAVNFSIDRINNDRHYSCGLCIECVFNGWNTNCRWADDQTQSLNKGMRPNNKTGFKNVSWDEPRQMWAVRIKRNKKYIFGGRFETLVAAVIARDNFLLNYEDGNKTT